MQCPNCETINRDGAKFCDECGFPLKDSWRYQSGAQENVEGQQPEAETANEPKSASESDKQADAFVDEEMPPEHQILEEGAVYEEVLHDEPVAGNEDAHDQPDNQQDFQSDDRPSGEPYDTIGEQPTTAIDGLSQQKTAAIDVDLAGFDRISDEFGETLVTSDYQAPERAFRDGGTMQMPKVDSGDAPKSKDYLASSTKKKNPKGKIIAAVVAVVAVVAALAIFGTYQMQLWGGKVIPDVSGMTEADARSILTDQGFNVRSAQVKSDDTEGLVLIMDPAAGTRADAGSEVVIHIATTRLIPEVVGKMQDEAAKLLADAGYENVKFEEKSSDKPRGTVLGVSPKAGERAKSTAEVTVKVAKPYVVPDVSGRATSDAIAAIEKAGLGYEVVYYDTNEYPEGTVVNTDPAAGTEVKKGAYIVLNVAQARGTKLEGLASSELGAGTTVEKGGKSYTIESIDSVAYIGNNTVSYTATAREFLYAFGTQVTNPETEQISGTIVFDENNQVVAIS